MRVTPVARDVVPSIPVGADALIGPEPFALAESLRADDIRPYGGSKTPVGRDDPGAPLRSIPENERRGDPV